MIGSPARIAALALATLLALLTALGSAQSVDIDARMTLPCEPRSQGPSHAAFWCRAGDDVFEGRIAIFAPGGIAPAADGALPDVREGVWSFDHGEDGLRELILHLHAGPDGAVADLYDRRSDLDGLPWPCCTAEELAGLNPTVRVRAPGGWTRSDGRPSHDLDLELDGNVYAIFGGSQKLEDHFRTDGHVDYEIHVRDVDGRPAYEYRRALVPTAVSQEVFRTGRAIERTAITVNEGGDEPMIRRWIPWPFLGPVTYDFLTNSALADSYPPIQVDFHAGRITTVGEFVRSRGNDNQWFVYSFDELLDDGVNVLGFESPFAFYDLFESEIALPELSLRMTHTQASSPTLFHGGHPHPVTGVRYSWIGGQHGTWRSYKLGLLGDHTPEAEITVDGIRLATFAPYDELPGWVTRRTWQAATFVAEMRPRTRPGTLGEGLHVWDVDTLSDRRFQDHVIGRNVTRTAATAGTSEIPEGQRGEYRLRPDLPARMYASAIDGELHLVGAAGGIWNQGGGLSLRYGNLAGGRYLDTWTLVSFAEASEASGEGAAEAGTGRATDPAVEGATRADAEGARIPRAERAGETILERLHHLPGHLLYADADGLRVKAMGEAPVVHFETPPPTDRATWSDLEARMTRSGPSRPFRTIRPMFDESPGRVVSLPSVDLLAASHAEDGRYLFLVEVHGTTGAGAPRTVGALDGIRFAPGLNVLVFDAGDGGWSAEPLRLAPVRASLDTNEIRQHRATALTLRIEHEGNYPLAAPATLRIGGEVVRTWSEMRLPTSRGLADATRETIYWSPPQAGTFDVLLEFDGEAVDVGRIEALPGATPPPRLEVARATFATGAPFITLFAVAALLVSLAVGRSLAARTTP